MSDEKFHLTIEDVFTSLTTTLREGEVLIPPERVRGLYPGIGNQHKACTCLDMGDEDDGPTVDGPVREVAAKLVATMNRRRDKDFARDLSLDEHVSTGIDAMLDDAEAGSRTE